MTAEFMHRSVLVGIVLLSLLYLPASAQQDLWWDNAWSFRQEIVFPSLTSDASLLNQPVDTTIWFDSPCWAENETSHSVRVICSDEDQYFELESQIYALSYSDKTHLTSCNIVFLIPPFANGDEHYYVYYDESSTASPDYPDYVSIEDSSYYYEPVPGYPLESHFYKIAQNHTIRYIVAQEGTFLWSTVAQSVTKLKEGSTDVMPKNGVAIASFEFVYFYDKEIWQYSSTAQELLSKEILYDGNLMVCCKIVSHSTRDDLRTTALYKYYYCPTTSERIHAHVIHEALKDCQVYTAKSTDGNYATLQCGGMQSASIADLNFGKIYPYYHFYSEQGTLEEYQVDLYPEYSQNNPLIRQIQTTDDVDIGKNAWVAFDEGTTGTVHAVVFGNTSVLKAGVDERDGIQLKMYESNYPHLPGLDYTVAALECTRNSYEKNDTGIDAVIPQGFRAEFDAEFFSSPVGGYPLAEKEAAAFQALLPLKPTGNDQQPSHENKSTRYHTLMVYVHEAPSFPFGSVLSVVTGRQFPYINVELSIDSKVICSRTAGRLPFKEFVSSEGSTANEIFSAALRSMDIRNISLFKRCSFDQLEAGHYLIKVFRENPRKGDERQFIGYQRIDLTDDASVHVMCRSQATCMVSLVDQQGVGVDGVSVTLTSDGMVITQNTTDTTGVTRLAAPYHRKNQYQLHVLYHGFEVANESLLLKYRQTFVPLKKSLALEQYDWTLTLVDLWGLPPEIDVTPRLSSTEMVIPTMLLPAKHQTNIYQFVELLPASYQLHIQYKSFALEKNVQIPSNDESLTFPAVFPISFHVYDSRGQELEDVTIYLSRGGITREVPGTESVIVIPLPPGLYLIKVLSQGNVIGQRSITVVGERSVDLLTNQDPVYPFVGIGFAVLLVCIGFVVGVLKKEPLYVLLLLTVGILVLSPLFPWWTLQGSAPDVQTTSHMFLVPVRLISTTITTQVIAGDHAFLPEIFTSVMTMIPYFIMVICLLLIVILVLYWMNKKRWQRLLFIGSLALLVSILISFIYAMSAFTEVGVGSFIGQGTLHIAIPGEDTTISMASGWGPGSGFWLCVIGMLVLVFTLLLAVTKKRKKE